MKVLPNSLAVTILMVELDALDWAVFLGDGDADEQASREELANALNQDDSNAAAILLQSAGWVFRDGTNDAHTEFTQAYWKAHKNKSVEQPYAVNIANIALVLAVSERDYAEARKILTVLENLDAA